MVMKEGSGVSTEWICSTDSNQYYPDTFTMYDAGSSVYYIIDAAKKKEYFHVRVDSRNLREDGSVLELGTLQSSYQIPFTVFSKQTFPARLAQQQSPSSLRLWIPGQQIVMQALYSQQQTPLDPQQSAQPLPQQTPYSSHPSLLKHPGRRGQQQQKSQNKSTFVSRSKGKSSSNPSSRAQQKQSAPKKQEAPPQPSSVVYQNVL